MNYSKRASLTDAGLRVSQIEITSPLALNELQEVFAGEPIMFMRQSWRTAPAKDFMPAAVRVGQRNGCLCVLAGMADFQICSNSTSNHQRLWELGDVFEIFLRPADRETYFEFQVSPNSHILQLRYPTANSYLRARESGSVAVFILREELCTAMSWVLERKMQWWVYVEIPLRLMDQTASRFDGTRWRASFCRYDYSSSREDPVISSTSQFSKPCFHAQEEWGHFVF